MRAVIIVCRPRPRRRRRPRRPRRRRRRRRRPRRRRKIFARATYYVLEGRQGKRARAGKRLTEAIRQRRRSAD
jgi:type VI secretion system secreted protein VgrG